ncbi:MAG: hypothetical protein IPK82_25185 [Polyangiaceae bacterium]|nr:hypothetical protein [Polyangiaceae bacterium]
MSEFAAQTGRLRAWRLRRGVAIACVLGATWAAPTSASAQDGAYGRLDGDVNLSLGAGASIAADAPGLAVRASAVYLELAGVYTGYVDALGNQSAQKDRSIAAGVSLRPMFWGRFANLLEPGPARLDLFIDSLALELGAFWAAPRNGAIDERPGFEIAVGLGFPIFASASGPFVEARAALRFERRDVVLGVGKDILDRGGMLTISVAWHQIVDTHIVDARDRIPR